MAYCHLETNPSAQGHLPQVKYSKGMIRQLPDVTNSQAKVVQRYLSKNLSQTFDQEHWLTTALHDKVYKKMKDDWSAYLKNLGPNNYEKYSHHISGSPQRPNTVRLVATGLPKRRIGRLHIGCTVNPAARSNAVNMQPTTAEYFTVN